MRIQEIPLPLRGSIGRGAHFPRVALRPRGRGLRSTRGYIPSPRRGEDARPGAGHYAGPGVRTPSISVGPASGAYVNRNPPRPDPIKK
jgi:hypothetical protein